jgi:hypothetical protein
MQLISLILFSNLITYLNYLLDWPLVRLANLRVPNFIDLKAVLLSIECAKSADPNRSLDSIYLTCNYIYGSPLLFFGKYLGLNSSNTSFYAWLLLIITSSLIGVITYISISNFKKALLVVSLVICSPAISLLFERANIDVIIFILVILSAWFYAKKQIFLSLAIIFIVTLLKFYTIFLLLILIFLHINKKNYYALIPITALTTAIVILDLARIEKFPVGGPAQFGTGVFSWYFDQIGFHIDKAIWFLIGIGVTLSITYLLTKAPQDYVPALSSKFNFRSARGSEIAFGWSSLIFLSCFLSGFNYDYRLVFLVLSGFLIFQANNSTKNYLWETMYFLSLWGSTGIRLTFEGVNYKTDIVFAFFQLIGDISTLVLASYLLAHFLRSVDFSSARTNFKTLIAKLN